jgi:RNA polymerase sigma factor (sigma-70 family)
MYSHTFHSLLPSLRFGIVGSGVSADVEVSAHPRAHQSELLRFLERMLGDRPLAVAVCDAAFRSVDESSPFRRILLFDAATALAIDVLRRSRAAAVAELYHQAPSIPAPAEIALRQALLTGAIDSLVPPLRHVFVLRYVTQMPRHEIAARLDISVHDVDRLLARALLQCRRALAARAVEMPS